MYVAKQCHTNTYHTGIEIYIIYIDIFTHVHRKLQYINCPKTGEDSHRLKAFELKYNSFPPRIRSKSPLYKVYMGLIKGTIPTCPHHFPYRFQVDVLSAKGANSPTWWYTNLSQITIQGLKMAHSSHSHSRTQTKDWATPFMTQVLSFFVRRLVCHRFSGESTWTVMNTLSIDSGLSFYQIGSVGLRLGFRPSIFAEVTKCASLNFCTWASNRRRKNQLFLCFLVGFPHEVPGNFYLKNWKGRRRRHRDSKFAKTSSPGDHWFLFLLGGGVSIPKRFFFCWCQHGKFTLANFPLACARMPISWMHPLNKNWI